MSKKVDSRLIDPLNRRIDGYNEFVEEFNTELRNNGQSDKLRLKKMKRVNDTDAFLVWLRMKNYILAELKDTLYIAAFQNDVTRELTHVKFELMNNINKSTYYKYVSKGYEIARDYLLYHHLMEL